MFWTYVLYSPLHKKIYIGYTSNLGERIKSHNELGKKGYSVKFRPWEIIFTEIFEKKEEALAREKALKKANGRRFIWELIRQKYFD